MLPGTRVWTRHPTLCWVRAVIRDQDEKGLLSVEVEDTGAQVAGISPLSVCEVDPSHNVDLDDVVVMSNLHEAPLLNLLQRRLLHSRIYTWVGQDILLSVNPYTHIPIYGGAHLELARAAAELEEPPHIYAIAQRAYAGIMLHKRRSHSVVISGESGAGKTEASKRVIEYLAFASKEHKDRLEGFGMEMAQPSSPARSGRSRRTSFGKLTRRNSFSRLPSGMPAHDRAAQSSSSIVTAFRSGRIRSASTLSKSSSGCSTGGQTTFTSGISSGSSMAAMFAANAAACRHRSRAVSAGSPPGMSPMSHMSSAGSPHSSLTPTRSRGTSLAAGASPSDALGRVQLAVWLEDSSVEAQVSLSLPALEAFGNAKTIRNNNSSRFGKYVAVHYDEASCIIGATTTHFLLERSRVVQLSPRERNYHIFYMLCEASQISDELHSDLRLHPSTEYQYLARRGDSVHVEGKDDAADFEEMRNTLHRLNVKRDGAQRALYRVLAAIIELGNIVFLQNGDNSPCTIETNPAMKGKDEEPLARAAALLGCDTDALFYALLNRTIAVPGRESIVTPLSAKDAGIGRDSLAKAIYSDTFDWLVYQINSSNERASQRFSNSNDSAHHVCSIGVLDIFGFEILAVNSFEQLCINYVNEMLQEHFNEMVFDAEQALMASLGLEPLDVDVTDHGPRLRLLTTLFARLDDQARNKQIDDLVFLRNLKYLSVDQADWRGTCVVNDRDGTFLIRHYASDVTYMVEGFAAKNVDALHADLMQLMDTCTELQAMLGNPSSSPPNHAERSSASAAHAKRTVSTKLRSGVGTVAKLTQPGVSSNSSNTTLLRGRSNAESIESAPLMSILSETAAHYVRCIKPNEAKAALGFAHKQVLDQLAYLGILEVVRIRQQGFPVRMPFEQFLRRYAPLYKFALRKDVHKLHEKSKNEDATSPNRSMGVSSAFLNGLKRVSKPTSPSTELSENESKLRAQKVLTAANLTFEGANADAAIGRHLVLLRNHKLSVIDSTLISVQRSTTLVQAFQRSRFPRRSFTRLRGAARTIQATQRRRLWWKIILATLQRFHQRVRALTIVALAHRVYTVMRHPKVAMFLRHRSSAALRLQCQARSLSARNKRAWLTLEKKQFASILRLQRNWRIFLLFRYLRTGRVSALHITSVARGWLARRLLRRAIAAAAAISRLTRGYAVRMRIASQGAAARRLQKQQRGSIARQEAARRRRGATHLQRWLCGNYHRLVMLRLFESARGGEDEEVRDILADHPHLIGVRADEPGTRPTLLHAIAEGGNWPIFEEVLVSLTTQLVGRPPALREACMIAIMHRGLRDAKGASCAHAAAAMAQGAVLRKLFELACGESIGNEGRAYLDLSSLKRAINETDDAGCHALHHCLMGHTQRSAAAKATHHAGAADGQQRARLACWLQEQGLDALPAELESDEITDGSVPIVDTSLASLWQSADHTDTGDVTGGSFRPVLSPSDAARGTISGSLRTHPSPAHAVLVRHALGGPTARVAGRWMAALNGFCGAGSTINGKISEEQAASLQLHYERSQLLWSEWRQPKQPPLRKGLSQLQVWIENLDIECGATGRGVVRSTDFITAQLIVEDEGSILTGGAYLRPMHAVDGGPWNRSKPSDAKPLGLPSQASTERLCFWRLWSSPALLTGWERASLLLRHYTPTGSICGWAHVRLSDLRKPRAFHVQMRQPPEPSRPYDLENGVPAPSWVHGVMHLACMLGDARQAKEGVTAMDKVAVENDLLAMRMTPREVKELVAELTRPPTRADEAASRMHAHRTLMELGAAANDAGDTATALRAFEAAFKLIPDDGVAILSAANMRLKRGQQDVARELYSWILSSSRLQLPPHAASMAGRKLQQLQA